MKEKIWGTVVSKYIQPNHASKMKRERRYLRHGITHTTFPSGSFSANYVSKLSKKPVNGKPNKEEWGGGGERGGGGGGEIRKLSNAFAYTENIK